MKSELAFEWDANTHSVQLCVFTSTLNRQVMLIDQQISYLKPLRRD